MKTSFKLLFPSLVLVTLCLASCTRSEFPQDTSNQEVMFSIPAGMGEFEYDESETKASISYVARLSWSTSDRISVINLSTNKQLGGTLVASNAGQNTTFVGTVNGTVSIGDKLLFIYPALKDSPIEQDIESFTLDFSRQDGSAASKVYIAGYLKGTATQTSNGMSVSTESHAFNFLASYSYVAISNLPESRDISKIRICGLPSKMVVTWDSDSNISTNSVYDTDDSESSNSINLISTGLYTDSKGDVPIYFTTPYVGKNNGYDRKIEVTLDDEKTKFIGSLPNSEYRIGYNARRMSSDFRRIDETSLSFSAPFTYNFYGDEDTYEFPENFDLYENGHQGWKRGDELSVVNLTTGELLQGTLWSEANGGITDFSGTVYGDKGLNEGDKLLLLYPAVGNESTMDFKTTPIIYDVSTEQDGTLGNVPLIMAAEATFTSDTVSFHHAYPFQHLTSIIQLSATLDPDYIEVEGGDIEVDGDDEEETENGDNEGFYEEGGAWSEEDYFGETSLDFTPTGMEVLHVPTKLMISYAGDEDYKLATINDGTDLISVSNDCGVTVEDSKASPFYISIPAAIGDAWGSYTSIAASYYSPDGIRYMTYDYPWCLKSQTFYEIDIPLPYDMADDMDGAEEGDENTNI